MSATNKTKKRFGVPYIRAAGGDFEDPMKDFEKFINGFRNFRRFYFFKKEN